MEDQRKRGPKPGSEASKRGGLTMSATYGSAFYAAIGRKGGLLVKEQRGSDFFAAIGRKGGLATRERGSDFYSTIGRLGGAARRVHSPPAPVVPPAPEADHQERQG